MQCYGQLVHAICVVELVFNADAYAVAVAPVTLYATLLSVERSSPEVRL